MNLKYLFEKIDTNFWETFRGNKMTLEFYQEILDGKHKEIEPWRISQIVNDDMFDLHEQMDGLIILIKSIKGYNGESMKIKELIEQLQKQNPEDEIHIWVDNEIGCGSEEFGRYYATEINILGRDAYYQSKDGYIRNFEELEEIIYDEYENISDEEIKEVIKNQIKSMQKLEGCWIYIQH